MLVSFLIDIGIRIGYNPLQCSLLSLTEIRMKKYFLLLFLFLLPSIVTSANFSKPVQDKETGIIYKKNEFGDFYLSFANLPQENISDQLSAFVENYSKKNPKKAFFVDLDIQKFGMIPHVAQANFKHFFTDEKHTLWVVYNNAEIPSPRTTICGTIVVLVEGDKVLAVEEATRRNQWGFPGGHVKQGEFPVQAAVRELKEEVGFTVNEENVKYIGDLQRVNANRFGANESTKIYMVKIYKGALKLQKDEIIQARWIPLQDLLQNESYDGLVLDQYNRQILKHIQNIANNNPPGSRISVPDCRQLWKSEEERDSSDILHVELFN